MILLSETYDQLQAKLLGKLERELPKDLHYHNVRHILDVIEQAAKIAEKENIDEEDKFLLKVGCLYHDSGFLFTYMGHEAEGCKLAKKELPAEGFTDAQIDIICGLIMATKVPQTPLTHLEKIICDADLDYLGRDDFFEISESLFKELIERKFIETRAEWNQRQVSFFKEHNYFTNTSQLLRNPVKQKHLRMIEEIM